MSAFQAILVVIGGMIGVVLFVFLCELAIDRLLLELGGLYDWLCQRFTK